MTDRIQTLTVTLDHDIREDDVQHIVDAIKMIRCVSDVQPGKPVDSQDYNARIAVRNEIGKSLQQLFLLAMMGGKEWEKIKAELGRLV